jgi:hypothetical protein
MSDDKNKQNIDQELDQFLGQPEESQQEDCNGDKDCMIKQNKGLVERINKTIVTEDGRQLLM